MANTKTLVWRGNASAAEAKPNLFEAIALDAMLPGTLIEAVATGFQTSATAATVFGKTPTFANRDVMRQKNMDEAWVINESAQAVEFRSGESGDGVGLLSSAAQGETIRDRWNSGTARGETI